MEVRAVLKAFSESDIMLSCDDALQFSLAFAKGSAWEPYAVYCSSPALRAELCFTLQRVYSKCCSDKYLAPNFSFTPRAAGRCGC